MSRSSRPAVQRSQFAKFRAGDGCTLGDIPIDVRSLHALALKIVERGRVLVPGLELWIVDRENCELKEIANGKTKKPIPLPADETGASWPDKFVLPGPAPTEEILQLASRGRQVLAMTVRALDGDTQRALAIVLTPFDGVRPSTKLTRQLKTIAQHTAGSFTNFEILTSAEARIAQLTALRDAAQLVSAELDLDRVLARICARTRALTHSDFAYIALLDHERNEIFARATDGVRTQAFKDLRLPLGQGLGGLVAKDAKPYYSSDYLHDDRFVHAVDPEVGGEGLVSVLGVPLKVADRVIGVLFAAHRDVRVFQDSDVDFMEMLADQAAVAIENGRLFQETQVSLAREQELRRVAEEQQRALKELGDFHDRLTELSHTAKNVEELLHEIGVALRTRVFLADAYSDDRIAVPVAAGGETLGWLTLDDSRATLRDFEAQRLEQAARVVAGHLLRDRALTQAEFRYSGEFLDELLAEGPVKEKEQELIRRGSYLGVDLSRQMTVLHILPLSPEDPSLADAIFRAARDWAPGCIVAGRGSGIVVVAPGREPRSFAEAMAKMLRRAAARFTMGVADEPTDLTGLPDKVREAQNVSRWAASAKRFDEATFRSEVHSYFVLLEGKGELRAFAERLLSPLIEYDERHAGNLLETLEAFLDCAGSPTVTARQLNLHINTLYYRLNRIREVGAYDFNDPDSRFALQLALRVRRAAGTDA